MSASIQAELPERLVEEAREYVRAGWAADLNHLLTDALRRYLESHAAGLAERFLGEDVDWGLHGRD
jgi:hypothetical protein